MAQEQVKDAPSEVAEVLEEINALARTLSLNRLHSAMDFMRFLTSEEEDDDWPVPSEEELADVEAFHEGKTSRFVPLEEARDRLNAAE